MRAFAAVVLVSAGLVAVPTTVSAQTPMTAAHRPAIVSPGRASRPVFPGRGTPDRQSIRPVSPGPISSEASSGGWKIVPSPNPQFPNGSFAQVACSSSMACEAVGSYTNSSGLTVTLAEGWNGAAWAPQATPNPTGATGSYLSGVACSSATKCEAVGYYFNASNLQVAFAEGWNGTTWALQAAANPTGAVLSLLSGVACTSSTTCEAIGSYTDSAGVQVTLAEDWNSTSWALQASPNPAGATSSNLYGVACPSTTVCEAVGDYTNSADVTLSLAEVWNGTTWAVQASPNPAGATSSNLYGVACPSTTVCEAVGDYTNSADVTLSLAEVWNGTTWALQASPNPAGTIVGTLFGVTCTSAACEGVGYYANSSGVQMTLAEDWNGTTWAVQSPSNPTGTFVGTLDKVTCTSAACEAVGYYTTPSGSSGTLAEGWDGTKWALQATPNSAGAIGGLLTGVACPQPTDCEAVGSYTNSSGAQVTLAQRWNGTTWALQSIPNPSGGDFMYLSGVACTSATSCQAVGFYDTVSGAQVSLAERWNGTTWVVQATPNPVGGTFSNLSEVACSSATPCEAVGDYFNSAKVDVTLAERWNGTTWALQATPEPTGATGGFLSGVACLSATACEAVGDYFNHSNVQVTLAERWNGSKWAIQATPNPTTASSPNLSEVACTSSAACEAVGDDTNSTDMTVTLAERWNGSKWAIQATPATSSKLSGVACTSATVCEAVGSYTNGFAGTLTEQWSP